MYLEEEDVPIRRGGYTDTKTVPRGKRGMGGGGGVDLDVGEEGGPESAERAEDGTMGRL